MYGTSPRKADHAPNDVILFAVEGRVKMERLGLEERVLRAFRRHAESYDMAIPPPLGLSAVIFFAGLSRPPRSEVLGVLESLSDRGILSRVEMGLKDGCIVSGSVGYTLARPVSCEVGGVP